MDRHQKMWPGQTELQTLMLIAIKDGRTPCLVDRTNRIMDVNDDFYRGRTDTKKGGRDKQNYGHLY